MKELRPIRVSKHEFQSLAEDGSKPLILGAIVEAEKFWRLPAPFNGEVCEILLCHEDYHLDPGVYCFSKNRVIVGLNQELFLLEECLIKIKRDLPCRFYEIVASGDGFFLVYHEIGFICFDFELNVRREWSGDLVSRWEILEGNLVFETLEGAQKRIPLLGKGKPRTLARTTPVDS